MKKFKANDIVIISKNGKSGNTTPVGTKVKIFNEVKYNNITSYNIVNLNGVGVGWVYEDEIEYDLINKKIIEEKIISLNNEISYLKEIIFIMSKNDINEISNNELKILRILDTVDKSISNVEKMKIISKIIE